jgi:hypothetical protein
VIFGFKLAGLAHATEESNTSRPDSDLRNPWSLAGCLPTTCQRKPREIQTQWWLGSTIYVKATQPKTAAV